MTKQEIINQLVSVRNNSESMIDYTLNDSADRDIWRRDVEALDITIDFMEKNYKQSLRWKPVKGFEGLYEVSNYGDIYSEKAHRILVPDLNKCGHLKVHLYKNGERKKHYVHRLVAVAFLPNPDNYAIVNHKDGNKQNNRVINLEWCTQSENIKHAWDNNLIKRKGIKKVNE